MKDINSILTSDRMLKRMIKQADKKKSYEEIMQCLDALDAYLFKRYCMKGYLESCEPEYCSYRILGTCDYLALLHMLQENHSIDLIDKRIG